MSTSSGNPWDAILKLIRKRMDAEDFRRWFGVTAYASDSGDQITVWVPTEAMRRHITNQFAHHIDAALVKIGRSGTHVRFIVTGISDDEEDEDD